MKQYFIAILFLVTFARHVLAEDNPNADTLAIATPQRALDAALSFVGLQMGKQVRSINSLSDAVQKVPVPDTAVLFYSQLDTTNDVWQVHLSLDSQSIGGYCSRLRSCVVLIDAKTGSFLEARLPTSDSALSVELQPTHYWERRIENSFFSFDGFLDTAPPKPLFEAFHAAMLSHPCLGSEVVAWCVRLKQRDGSSTPYWCIIGRNSRFLETYRPKDMPSRDGMLMNYLSLINATTGEPRAFMN